MALLIWPFSNLSLRIEYGGHRQSQHTSAQSWSPICGGRKGLSCVSICDISVPHVLLVHKATEPFHDFFGERI